MDERTILVVCFGIGVALEALYLIRNNINWVRLGFCAVLALALTAYGYYKSDHDSLVNIALGFAIFAFVFAYAFKDDILPVVTEKMLLSYSIIFWYGFVTSFYDGTHGQQILMILCALPSAVTVYAAFTLTSFNFWGKLLLYVWFLVIVVSLALFQFPYGSLSIFDGNKDVPWLGWLDGLLTGMASTYLVVNVTYLFMLLPIPAKSQTFSDRMKEWRELTNLMTQRCVDEGATTLQTLLTVAIVTGILLLNHAYPVLPSSLLMSVAILVSAVVFSKDSTNRALHATSAIGENAISAPESAPAPRKSRR